MDKESIKRILVITLSNTGDVILTTPVVEVLLREFPNVKLDIVVGPNGKEVFEKHKKISKIFVYDKHAGFFEKFRLVKKLRNMHYDLVIDLRNTLLPFLIGVRFRSKVLNRTKNGLHKKDQHLSLLTSLGIRTEGVGLHIEIDREDFKNIDELLKDIKDKFIVVSSGAKSHVKRWPASYFAAISDIINWDLGYEVILVGKDGGEGPDADRVVGDLVKGIMQSKPIDFIGKTNLRELSALLKKAALLITNDSAPLHVASAVNTPTIAIFGPTDERKYGPLSEKNIILRKEGIECAPCEEPQCKYNYECMREITVDDAVKAVKKILGA